MLLISIHISISEVKAMASHKFNKSDFVKAKVHTSITPGQAIKMVRKLQGMTQDKLSKITCITQSNLSALETDVRQLGRERAIVLARALKVHPTVLLLFPDYDILAAA
jgi:DNA-binding transcriptional regulator YiaG